MNQPLDRDATNQPLDRDAIGPGAKIILYISNEI